MNRFSSGAPTSMSLLFLIASFGVLSNCSSDDRDSGRSTNETANKEKTEVVEDGLGQDAQPSTPANSQSSKYNKIILSSIQPQSEETSRVTSVNAVVIEVRRQFLDSPSISHENNVAIFQIVDKELVPNSKSKFLWLNYGPQSMYLVDTNFVVGDKWEFQFDPDGILTDLNKIQADEH